MIQGLSTVGQAAIDIVATVVGVPFLAEPFIEAAVHRAVWEIGSEKPLAEDRGAVAIGEEYIGHRQLALAQEAGRVQGWRKWQGFGISFSRPRANPSLRSDSDEKRGRGERRSSQRHDHGFVGANGRRDLAQGGGGVLRPTVCGEGGGGENPIGKPGSGTTLVGEGAVGFVELNEDRIDRGTFERV